MISSSGKIVSPHDWGTVFDVDTILSLSFPRFSLEYWLIVAIASISAIALGGLLALIFIPKITGG